ncbi:hypothetical protein C8Q79DRAFT_521952 [Trametes meyenii]|nr:hypothetical protein C8Q79DRAFT_521952 [Trametes meyenii]
MVGPWLKTRLVYSSAVLSERTAAHGATRPRPGTQDTSRDCPPPLSAVHRPPSNCSRHTPSAPSRLPGVRYMPAAQDPARRRLPMAMDVEHATQYAEHRTPNLAQAREDALGRTGAVRLARRRLGRALPPARVELRWSSTIARLGMPRADGGGAPGARERPRTSASTRLQDGRLYRTHMLRCVAAYGGRAAVRIRQGPLLRRCASQKAARAHPDRRARWLVGGVDVRTRRARLRVGASANASLPSLSSGLWPSVRLAAPRQGLYRAL